MVPRRDLAVAQRQYLIYQEWVEMTCDLMHEIESPSECSVGRFQPISKGSEGIRCGAILDAFDDLELSGAVSSDWQLGLQRFAI